MSWGRSYKYKTISIHFESFGGIGFDIKDEDSETVKAIKNNDPIIFEALNIAMRQYPEIATVNDLLDYTFEYYVGDRLKYADEEALEDMERNLKVFINSDYAPEGLKGEAREWLDKVLYKLATRRQVRAKKEKVATADKGGYIYLVKAETGHYKIGRTKNLPDRMNFFGVKLPFEIELIKAIPVDDTYRFENLLHQLFVEERVNGEWFALRNTSVKNIASLTNQADLEDYISCMMD